MFIYAHQKQREREREMIASILFCLFFCHHIDTLVDMKGDIHYRSKTQKNGLIIINEYQLAIDDV